MNSLEKFFKVLKSLEMFEKVFKNFLKRVFLNRGLGLNGFSVLFTASPQQLETRVLDTVIGTTFVGVGFLGKLLYDFLKTGRGQKMLISISQTSLSVFK